MGHNAYITCRLIFARSSKAQSKIDCDVLSVLRTANYTVHFYLSRSLPTDRITNCFRPLLFVGLWAAAWIFRRRCGQFPSFARGCFCPRWLVLSLSYSSAFLVCCWVIFFPECGFLGVFVTVKIGLPKSLSFLLLTSPIIPGL